MTHELPHFLRDVDWVEAPQPNATTMDSDLPYVTHSGVLELAGQSLRCYRLSDGRAIFDAHDMTLFMEWLGTT